MTTPTMSVVDVKGTALLLLDLNGRDVYVTREQLEAVTQLTEPQSVTIALSRALQMMADAHRPCHHCGQEPTVDTDNYGARLCQDHVDAARRNGWSAS